MMTTITNNLLNEGQYFDNALPSCLLFDLLTLFASEKDIISAVDSKLSKTVSCHSNESNNSLNLAFPHSMTAATRLLPIERALNTDVLSIKPHLLQYSINGRYTLTRRRGGVGVEILF
jgi:hypothetical protein